MINNDSKCFAIHSLFRDSDAIIVAKEYTVTVDGKIVKNAEIVTQQIVLVGPGASQIAIKQSGTNGGGFYGVNAAHP
ncbi:MAG: potassium-transporting ATPase subunit KdpA, partial [Clostridiales bacterium]